MMTEGQEKDEFWDVLGGKGDYSNSPRLQVPLYRHVLFEFVNNSSEFPKFIPSLHFI